MKFRFWMPIVAALALVLNGCGGGGDGGDGQVRFVNATTDYDALDYYEGDTLLAGNVASNGVSEYSTLGDGSYAFTLKVADSSTVVTSTSRAITSDLKNTLVTYNTNGVLSSAYFTDNEDEPTAGAAKFRVYNASYEAGNIDVYVTPTATDLDTVSPKAQNLAGERASVYTEISAGSYRLRITGTGNTSDLRLDVPITLADQEIVTLIVTKTPGGVLVNGLLLDQGGAATSAANTKARVRVVAGAADNGLVSATINGVVLATGLKSPLITPYVLVNAGALTSTIQINGSTVAAPAKTVAVGSDTTLLVLGTPAAPTLSYLNDINVPSANASLPTRLRLVSAINGQTDPITLTANFEPIASNIPFASASTAAYVQGDIEYRLEVTSPTALLPLYTEDAVTLQSGKVYTLFMLGDLDGQVVGALRLDR